MLSSQLAALGSRRASHLQGLTETEHANETRHEDADDSAQRAGDREVESGVSDIESAKFDAIGDALQRIHGEGSGLCAGCHAPIPFERLAVEPQATRCTDCQSLHEHNS